MSQDMLNLRIVIPGLQITKMMQFAAGASVDDAIALIQSKIPESVKPNTKAYDYCLYQQSAEDEKIGRWLNKQANIAHYSFKQGDQLELKDVNRLVRFKLPDESMKTIMVDETKLVGEIFKIMCARAGITSVDEYSLAIESAPEEISEAGGAAGKKDASQSSATLKKSQTTIGISMKKIEEREKRKMEKMKQKLHTDDEIRWVEHDKTLCEQGIDSSCLLSVRRKYFYESNRNVFDPKEINIVYTQCRDDILSCSLMCTTEEAIKLAALQMQVQHGDFEEGRFKNLAIKEYLPKDQAKGGKSVEKKIKEEYKNLVGVSELDAKQRYCTFCQGLKLYGTSIFLVKEKMPGKQKLGPILFGITKENILRLDDKTKEVLKTWPLTSVRRWAASPNSFTLDFGDYDEMYSVMTPESEAISKLISGYIDLILKKKRAQASDTKATGVALVEESIQPGQGIMISSGTSGTKPKGKSVSGRKQQADRQRGYKVGQNISSQGAAARLYGKGAVSRVRHAQQQKFSSPLKAFIFKLEDMHNNFMDETNSIISETMDQRDITMASVQNNKYMQKQLITANLSSLSNSLAIILQNVQDTENPNYNVISSQMVESQDSLLKALRALKQYGIECPDLDQDELLNLLKELCQNYQSVFDAFKVSNDQIQEIDMKAFQSGYNGVAVSNKNILKLVGICEVSPELLDGLLAAYKHLSKTCTKLISESKNVSDSCSGDDQKLEILDKMKLLRNDVILTGNLLAMLGPTLLHSKNSEILIDSAQHVERKISELVNSCEENENYDKFDAYKGSAAQADDATTNFIKLIKELGIRKQRDPLLNLLEGIINGMDNLGEDGLELEDIKGRSKDLAINLGKLLTGMKEEISNTDDDALKNDLFASAKALADVTKNLLDNTRNLQKGEFDAQGYADSQKNVVSDVYNILKKNYKSKFKDIQLLLLKKHLQDAITASISMETSLINSIDSCRSETLAKSLIDECDEFVCSRSLLTEYMGKLEENHESPYYQMEVISRAKNHCANSKKIMNLSRNAVPLIADFDHSTLLNKSIRELDGPIKEIEKILGQIEEFDDSMLLELSKNRIEETDDSIKLLIKKFENGTLERYPNEDVEIFQQKLLDAYREIIKVQAQLNDPANHDNKATMCMLVEKLTYCLHKSVSPLYSYTSCCPNDSKEKESYKLLLKNFESIMESSRKCCLEALKMLDGDYETPPDDLLEAIRNNSDVLLNLISSLPTNQEMEVAIKKLNSLHDDSASKKPVPPLQPGLTYLDIQKKISENISSILETIAEFLRLVSREENQSIPATFGAFAKDYSTLHGNVRQLIACHPDKEIADDIDDCMKSVIQCCNRLVSTLKLYVTDPNPSSTIFFSEAAKNFSDSLSNMLLTILSSKPGRRECESCKNLVKLTYLPMLESSNSEIFTQKSYKECLDEIEKVCAKSFDTAEDKLIKATESDDALVNIGQRVKDLQDILVSIVKNASHASYIVGISDSASTSGRSAVFNEALIKSNRDLIIKAFENTPTKVSQIRPTDVDNLTKECIKASGNIMISCKESVNQLNGNPQLQKQLLDIVNSFASKTKDCLGNIKNYESCKTDKDLSNLIDSSKKTLIKELDKFEELFDSPEVQSMPGKISDRGRLMQQPIITVCFDITNTFVDAIEDVCSLIQDFDDQTKAGISDKLHKTKSDIGHLIETMKSQAPGDKVTEDVILSLVENEKNIQQLKNEAISKPPHTALSTFKENENKFELTNSNLINVLNESLLLTKKSPHFVPGKLETAVNLIQAMPEIINWLATTIGSIDKESQSKLFDQLLKLNDSLMHSANSLRLKPVKLKGKDPMSSEESINSAIADCKRLSDLIAEISQRYSGINSVIQSIIATNKALTEKRQIQARATILIGNRNYEKELVDGLKNTLKICQDLIVKSSTNPEMVETRCKDLQQNHEKCTSLINDPQNIRFAPDVKDNIRKKYGDFGSCLKDFAECLSRVYSNPSNQDYKKELGDKLKHVSSGVSDILKLIQSSHKGAAECIKLSDQVFGILNEIESCILFAENDSLECEADTPPMATIKDDLIKCREETKKALNELGSLENYTDNDLLEFSEKVAKNIKDFLEFNKNASMSLGSGESQNQLSLLNSCKNIGSEFVDLLENFKSIDEKPEETKVSVKDRVKKIENLITDHNKVFEKVEKSAGSGSEALSASAKKIQSMIEFLNPKNPCPWDSHLVNAVPEELVLISKEIPLSCAKILQYTTAKKDKEREDFLKKGNTAFEGLFKGVRKLIITDTNAINKSVADALKVCADSYIDVLKSLESAKPGSDKKVLGDKAKKVTENVVVFVKKCSELKGESHEDPSTIAEKELLNAAQSIEMAAKKLAELKPKIMRPDQPNMELSFQGQILVAANSIMNATSALVAAATIAQKELVKMGVFQLKADDKEGGEWSQGLISSAKLVAQAANMLVDAAKSAVEGKANEEKLIAACNAIASSTARLIMACKVKMDPNSETQTRLEKAGSAIKKASRTLVESLKGSGVFGESKNEGLEVETTQVGGMRQELDAMEEIAKREKELIEAREKLIKIRQAKAPSLL